MTATARALAFCLAALALSACSPPVDLKQAIQVTDVTSGWFDAGIVDGKNKLVPTITFRLKKAADVDVPTLAINVVYKKDGETDHWDDVYVQRVDFVDGTATLPITVRSETGYTGDPPQSRAEMLKHAQFRDMDAQIFVKASSSQWIELHRLRLARQLLTQ
jgi:hypothetical protein